MHVEPDSTISQEFDQLQLKQVSKNASNEQESSSVFMNNNGRMSQAAGNRRTMSKGKEDNEDIDGFEDIDDAIDEDESKEYEKQKPKGL